MWLFISWLNKDSIQIQFNGSFRKDQSTSDATLILKATDEFDESCKLESDNLNGPDERVKSSLHCSSRAIKDGRKRKQRILSCDETSFTSIYQGGCVVDTQEESTLSNEATVEAERQLMATAVQESPRPACGHYQRRCLTLFPCCGKFFPCHRCHNESDCTEDRATAVNATHIRCTICYNEQVVRLYLRTEFKISSLDEIYSNIAKFPQMQSNRHVKRNIINWLPEWFFSLICVTFSVHFRSMKIARGAAPATRKCLNISVQRANTLRLLTRTLSIARSVGSAG